MAEDAADVGFSSRREAHRWAKSQLKALRRLNRRARRAERRARKRAADVQRAHQQAKVDARLSELTIEGLAPREGVRVKALQAAGIYTARDVQRAGAARLKAIKGVGEQSIGKLMSRLTAQQRPRPEDRRIPADPASWITADRVLVGALQALSIASALTGSPRLAAVQHLLVALKAAAWATNLLGWLFASKIARAERLSRLSALRARRGSPVIKDALKRLEGALDDCARYENGTVTDAEVVERWRQSSADSVAQLDRLLGDADLTATGGDAYVSADVRQRIDATSLRTDSLKRVLRKYQVFGAKFIVAAERGLLGDEMGLGKTIQALAAMAHLTAEGQRHHVVVCPTSLLDNWEHEVDQTVTGLTAWTFHSDGRETAFDGWRSHGGVLLTTYLQTKHLLDLETPPIGLLVIDEAHKVKRPDTKSAMYARELLPRARRALLMSGTMMENRAAEMIDLAGLVDSAAGARLTTRFQAGATAMDEPEAFRRELGRLYLRRNQDEVLGELPPMISEDIPVSIGEPERAAYIDALRRRNLARARISLSAGAGTRSAKIDHLTDIVEEYRNRGEKILVFSAFRQVLEPLCEAFGEGCLTVHGDVRLQDRKVVIDTFKTSPTFALLAAQIDTVGVGLNLQEASVVVLMEPQLKPSTEWQAIKRAHRMGQTRRVIVHRLVARDSADERITQLTDLKAEMFEALAEKSHLADSSPAARDAAFFSSKDNQVDSAQLLDEERRRFGLES